MKPGASLVLGILSLIIAALLLYFYYENYKIMKAVSEGEKVDMEQASRFSKASLVLFVVALAEIILSMVAGAYSARFIEQSELGQMVANGVGTSGEPKED